MNAKRIPGYEHIGGRRIVIRETDDYLEYPGDQGSPPASPWIRTLVQPAIIGTMVACIAWSVLQLTRAFNASWSPVMILLTPVVTALIGCASQRAVQERYLSNTDSLRFRVIELLVMLVLTKSFGFLDETPAQVWAEIRSWSRNPTAFFDAETMTVYVLGVAAWLAAGATIRDLGAVTDPTRYVGEEDPVLRLSRRFFIGGYCLLVITGLARVSLSALASFNHGRVRGFLVNVLLYFGLGLVMLGQLRFTWLSGLWQRERVRVTESLSGMWLRYTLLILGIAGLIALLLPTGYTLPLLDLISYLFFLLIYIVSVLYFLISWPIGLLLSLLLGRPRREPRPPLRPLPVDPAAPKDTGPAPPWLMVIRSLLFWGLVLGGLIYLVRIYLRDRPEMGRTIHHALKDVMPIRWIGQLWRALQRWWQELRRGISTHVPDLIQRMRRRVGAQDHPVAGRSKGKDLQEKVFYHYFTTLDRAKDGDLERRGDQTPYEYEQTLATELPSESEALNDLTETFVVARYSPHPVTGEMVRRAEKHARDIQTALRDRTEKNGSK